MTGPFGADPLTVFVGTPRSEGADVDLVHEKLPWLAGARRSELHLVEPLPTAAFSRRDRLLPGYPAAMAIAMEHGFTPVVRPVGGHLAVYGDGAVVLHHWARHDAPRLAIRERFGLMGEALAGALVGLGVDARVGPVPGEYCDGEFSVNDSGRAKLVGTGQRIVRAGYLFSAVIMVHSIGPVREALVPTYRELGLPFDPATVGCIADSVPGVTVTEVVDVVVTALVQVLSGGPGSSPFWKVLSPTARQGRSEQGSSASLDQTQVYGHRAGPCGRRTASERAVSMSFTSTPG